MRSRGPPRARTSFLPSLRATLNHILIVDDIGARHGEAAMRKAFVDD